MLPQIVNNKSRLLLASTFMCVVFATAAQTSESTSATDVNSDAPKNPEQLAEVLLLDADLEYGAYLGGECLTCHAPDDGDGSISLIHGKSKSYLASALLEYKNLQRENQVMRGVTAALSNEEVAALAAFFSEQQ